MIRLLVISFALLLAAPSRGAGLEERLRRVLDGPRFERALAGVAVVSLADGETVFTHNADRLFQPASSAKLFTAALVLDRLDPAQRIQTSAYATAQPDPAGRVAGDLVIYGRGDPSFAPRFHKGDGMKPFREFAALLHGAGLRHVAGDLVADESHFNAPRWGTGWTWDELGDGYAAEVSALSAFDNVAYLTVLPGRPGERVRLQMRPKVTTFEFLNGAVTGPSGGASRLHFQRSFGLNRLSVQGGIAVDARGETRELTVARPAGWFGLLLKEELERIGVRIDGGVRVLNWHERLTEPRDNSALHHLGSVPSPPLGHLLETMMKESQNLYAQLLLLQAGSLHPRGGLTTDAAGLLELAAFLRGSGIDPDDVRLEEGSGLSRRSLVTPAAMTRLLARMDRHPRSAEYLRALPVAGVDGTLAGRFHGTSAERNLRAKTGTLNQVSALAGYVADGTGARHAFAILLNNHPGTTVAARAAVDALAVEIAR